MAVTGNSAISAQGLNSANALCTATKNTFNDLAHIQMYPNRALGWIKRACNA